MTGLLHLLQFGDSALPIGGFSFSHGLESAAQQGLVHDAATLREFVLTVMRQSATSDGVALLNAHRAAALGDLAALAAIDRAAFERKLNEEVRLMTVRMGRKLAELAVAVIGDDLNRRWLQAIQRAAPSRPPARAAARRASLGGR